MRAERLRHEVRRALEDFLVPELQSLRDELELCRSELAEAVDSIRTELRIASQRSD